MIHLPIAWFAILTAPEPAPRPEVVPEDLDPDLRLQRLLGEAPGLLAAIREDRGPLPNLVVNPPSALPEVPYTAPPNRAQRRAKRRNQR